MHVVAVVGGQRAEACSAEKRCLLKNRIEHRRQVAKRAVDHLQNFRRRSLLPHKLVAFGKAGLQPLFKLSGGLPEICQFGRPSIPEPLP
jgi:hypothetical protein